MKRPIFALIGYSLDSVMWAREIALSGEKVYYIKTGKLGYPLDDIRDYISYEDVLKIKTLQINPLFKRMHNSSYVFLPYEQLKFVNNRNGLISYPLNENSFESAEEWEQIEVCLSKINKFRDELEKANNFLNIYKKFFPKWLYDCLLKYMGVNKWGGFRQSKFTKAALAKEINLSCLDGTTTGSIFRPEVGYEKLCDMMLEHENIKTFDMSIVDLKKFIIQRHKNMEVVLMDNRVDYICNYTCDNFDRVKFTGERIKDLHLEEFMDISEGIVLTPMKDYFCITNEEGRVIKVKATKIEDFNYIEQSDISPTNYNKKLYNEYKKMINLYSGKTLNLDPVVVTTIK